MRAKKPLTWLAFLCLVLLPLARYSSLLAGYDPAAGQIVTTAESAVVIGSHPRDTWIQSVVAQQREPSGKLRDSSGGDEAALAAMPQRSDPELGESEGDGRRAPHDDDIFQVRIKAYYVNMNGSFAREGCMNGQLESLRQRLRARRVELSFERFPAVGLGNCTDPETCLVEKPECFPSMSVGRIEHGGEQNSRLIRGVIGNFCSHYKVMERAWQESAEYDYFFIFEDDSILEYELLVRSLKQLLRESQHHWAMVVIDTSDIRFHDDGVPYAVFEPPVEDRADTSIPLYVMSHEWGYWGGQAWLLDSHRLDQLMRRARKFPVVPADWIPKMTFPPHLSIMAYQIGAVRDKQYVAASKLEKMCAEIVGSDIQEGPHGRRLQEAAEGDERPDGRRLQDGEAAADRSGAQQSVAADPFEACWTAHSNSFSLGYAAGVSTLFNLAEAKARCLEPSSNCAAVTCGATGACTLRESTTLRASPESETTYRNICKVDGIVMFGMYRSGTILFRRLLQSGMEAPFKRDLCGGEVHCGGMWKHTHPARIKEALELGSRFPANEILAVAVVRHPFSMIRSLQRSPTGLKECAGRFWDDGGGPCKYEPPVEKAEDRVRAIPAPIAKCHTSPVCDESWEPERAFDSLAKSWNEHVKGYLQLEEHFGKVAIVRYEDLVENPAIEMKEVSKRAGWPVQEADLDRLVSEPARKKLTDPNYGANFTEAQMTSLCEELNRPLMSRLGYRGCEVHGPQYDAVIVDGRTPSRGKCTEPLDGVYAVGEPMNTKMFLIYEHGGTKRSQAADPRGNLSRTTSSAKASRCLSGHQGYATAAWSENVEDCHIFVLSGYKRRHLSSASLSIPQMCLTMGLLAPDEFRFWPCSADIQLDMGHGRVVNQWKCDRQQGCKDWGIFMRWTLKHTWGEYCASCPPGSAAKGCGKCVVAKTWNSTFAAASADACCSRCKQITSCQGYNFNRGSSSCTLLTNITGVSRGPGYTSFVKPGVLPPE